MAQSIFRSASFNINVSPPNVWEHIVTNIVSLDSMMPVLLNKYIRYPESVYSETIYRQTCRDNQGLRLYFIHIPPNLLGVEFTKTHVYYIKKLEQKYAGFVQVLSGQVKLIAQKKHFSNPDYTFATSVEEVKIKSIDTNTKVSIPSGFLFTFINCQGEDAIVSIMCRGLYKLDYSEIEKEKGLAFYIISKNTKTEIVANPRYRVNKFNDDDIPDRRFEHDLLRKSNDIFSLISLSDKLYEVLA